jgi:hypothetical protein
MVQSGLKRMEMFHSLQGKATTAMELRGMWFLSLPACCSHGFKLLFGEASPNMLFESGHATEEAGSSAESSDSSNQST